MTCGRLDRKRVLVTGSGAGLGRAIALRAAAEGAEVIVASLGDNGADVVAEIEGRNGAAIWCRCDVTDRQQVEAAVALAVGRGGLHGAVHNAIARGSYAATSFEEWEPDLWEKHVAVALRGAYHVAAATGAALADQRGSLVLMTSAAAIEGIADLGIYATVKAATRGLARGLAREWGPAGVRVNIVAPLARTPTVDRTFASDPSIEPRMARLSALRRIGDGETDVAPVIAFLLSDDARYVSGQTIAADGGRLVPL
jgi:NAD(P)-dependent dehydrogenase (short-subunit alcohol dehydrogenase family)